MDTGPSSRGRVSRRALLCVGNGDELVSLRGMLADSIWDLTSFPTAEAAVASLSMLGTFDVALTLILDAVPDELAALRRLVRSSERPPWVALVQRSVLANEIAREFVAGHCADYLSLPIDRDRLLHSLGHAAGMAALQTQKAQRGATAVRELLGASAVMRKLDREIQKVAAVDAPVLITGESGTGKELVARSIHERSQRAKLPFVAVNCVSLSPSLIHAELFGHERGAFTGAERRKIGHIEAADGGTLFLDEIGDLPPEPQALLLRFLEERVIRRVGGRDELPIDTRIICATHVDLEEAVRRRQFREDLYFRLNVLRIQTPPLRERREDIEPLARACLARHVEDRRQRRLEFSSPALLALRNFQWPGNVRELLNRVRRAVVMSDGPEIMPSDLGFQAVAEPSPLPISKGRLQAEHKLLIAALESGGWRAKPAAQSLGVSRATFYRMLQRHGISLSRGTGRIENSMIDATAE